MLFPRDDDHVFKCVDPGRPPYSFAIGVTLTLLSPFAAIWVLARGRNRAGINQPRIRMEVPDAGLFRTPRLLLPFL